MKYISLFGLCWFVTLQSFGQSTPIEQFLNGKSAVFISASSAAQPAYSWKALAEELHGALVEAGGDPVAYYELEEAVLSDAIKNAYAAYFTRRLIKNIIMVVRKENGSLYLHIFPFSQDNNIITQTNNWSTSSSDLEAFLEDIKSMAGDLRSENFLVLEVPEYPAIPGLEQNTGGSTYIQRAPLNLDTFKLGVLLSGASGDEGFLTTFRHDLYGKPAGQVAAEQEAEKEGLETVFSNDYPFEVTFLTSPKSNQELIREGTQFILMRQEGREEDLMRSMGVPLDPSIDGDRIVVKYYIRFLVRNEYYIGENWDAHPDWRVALSAFLNQITP